MVGNHAKKVNECLLNQVIKYCLCTIGTTRTVHYTEQWGARYSGVTEVLKWMEGQSGLSNILCPLLKCPTVVQPWNFTWVQPTIHEYSQISTPCLTQYKSAWIYPEFHPLSGTIQESMNIARVPPIFWHKHAIAIWMLACMSIHSRWMWHYRTTRFCSCMFVPKDGWNSGHEYCHSQISIQPCLVPHKSSWI